MLNTADIEGGCQLRGALDGVQGCTHMPCGNLPFIAQDLNGMKSVANDGSPCPCVEMSGGLLSHEDSIRLVVIDGGSQIRWGYIPPA